MHGTVSIHQGPYESISENVPPDLRFLSRFLPAVDSVNPTQDPFGSFFKCNASIIIGGNLCKPAQSATHYDPQSDFLSYFHRHLHMAWDLDLTSTGSHTFEESQTFTESPIRAPWMKHTVMFEATSETTFKDDPDQFPVRTGGFNILDLEGTSDTGLEIIGTRIFLDAKPIQARAASWTKSPAYGESQRETQAD
ncbi:uncharacterized protein N7484_008074 [Penicillium longicatenatum]|uniref:uncharacterized protein n=1 Tax=Penicillium longicatenatum TaxID=1561947 RepID=UPI00254666E6|nr:uncharacterized protein N7484_008074 [Penicillium longicatenatum]KAJ5640212.1 hypothetical protein N7484_008074 [Penicillium longicatenatum]